MGEEPQCRLAVDNGAKGIHTITKGNNRYSDSCLESPWVLGPRQKISGALGTRIQAERVVSLEKECSVGNEERIKSTRHVRG